MVAVSGACVMRVVSHCEMLPPHPKDQALDGEKKRRTPGKSEAKASASEWESGGV